jgi:hypothetical protein
MASRGADASVLDLTSEQKRRTSLQSRKLNKTHLIVEVVFKAYGTILDIIDNQVYSIHQSVKDYIEEEDPLKSLFEIPPRLIPAYACLVYLSSEDFRKPRDDLEEFPFLEYAHRYWNLHIESTADFIRSDSLRDILVQLIAPIQLRTWPFRMRLLRLREKIIIDAGGLSRYYDTHFTPLLKSDRH